MKILVFLMFLAVIIASTALAVLITGFAGSVARAPEWYLPYLALTQAIPILVYLVTFLVLAVQLVFSKPDKLVMKVLLGSVVIYMTSFAFLLLLAKMSVL